MVHVPLIQHSRPRVLMLDFSPQDVMKVQQAGYDAKRGTSGVKKPHEFSLPFATQDVEVVFAYIQDGSFFATGDRKQIASADSVEKSPFFEDLLRETWQKAGWIVLFLAQDISPFELTHLGIGNVGVIADGRRHQPESIREPWGLAVAQYNMQPRLPGHTAVSSELSPPKIPRFIGQDAHIAEGPEKDILLRYIKSAKLSVLSCLQHPYGNALREYSNDPHPHIVAFKDIKSIIWLIADESADENVMALKLKQSVYAEQRDNKRIYHEGGILLLPDFGENNGNVALALLQETIPQISPHLFDTPQHAWLEKYEPAPVLRLHAERDAFLEAARAKLQDFEDQAEAEREKYSWLPGLLVSTGNQFETDVAKALGFLDFEVEEVDNALAPGERKREDLRIQDKLTDYFALGEAKTTGKGRGPSEEFIHKTQTHINRYGRENSHIPPALLIINYAIDLEPRQRTARFYQSEVAERLEDNRITAINSVALFDLCQAVLDEQLSKEAARRHITSGQPLIVSVNIAEIASINDYSTA